MSDQLYSVSGVAQVLNVKQSAVCNWRNRYSGTPEPQYIVRPSGWPVWDVEGMHEWCRWYEAHERARHA